MFTVKSAPDVEEDLIFFIRTHEDILPTQVTDIRLYRGVQRLTEALERLLVGVVEVDNFPEEGKLILGDIAHLIGQTNWSNKQERALEIESWLVSILNPIEGSELPIPEVDTNYTTILPESPLS